MDLWVKKERWESFIRFVNEFGLKYEVKDYFENSKKENSGNFLTTTNATLNFNFTVGNEAHVFISKSKDNCVKAMASGWYPLFLNGNLIEKNYLDHIKFGKVLGYPECCINFFILKNNWQNNNHYYAAFQNSNGRHNYLCNCLLRHTKYSLIPHICCSFNCSKSALYSNELMSIIEKEKGEYFQKLKSNLLRPALVLSEKKIFQFEGKQINKEELVYSKVKAVNPTDLNGPMITCLKQANRVILDANIVRIYNNSKLLNTFQIRTDRYEPEAPFFFMPF